MAQDASENIDYRKLVSSAKKRIELLERQENAIQTEIAMLRESIRLYEPFENADVISFGTIGGSFKKVDIPEYGFTTAVRMAISPVKAMTPSDVRDELIRAGYDFKGRKNPLANIQEVLRRLVGQRQAKQVSGDDGKTRYLKISLL